MSWTQQLIHTERGKFEVFVKGQGPPLAVTHLYSEFNETGDYFADCFTSTYKVYLINLRECGESEQAHSPHQLSLLETVLDLEAIRQTTGLERWSFAGHSTGGILGVVYSIYFSESIDAQFIVSAAGREYMTFSPQCIYNENHPDFKTMQDLIEKLKKSDLSHKKRKTLTIERTKLSLYRPDLYKEIFNKNIEKTMSATRMSFFARELHLFDVTRKLQLIDVPTRIVCGQHDVQCPLPYSIEMAEYIPRAELIVFEHSNHYPHLEEPAHFKAIIARAFD
ncbi:alpha/beta fold hydrolase [Halobacillus sp. H74]|uniref:alpha/beta fold hydrolase n=1 Tax=Halobacillus sp. H74 TaxID=3457436 RepID=UPI003FCEE2FB